MKIAFFGTSEFGIETLEALHKEFSVEFVVTNPARPANRGKKLMETPIFECAKRLGIQRIYTPEKLTKEFEEYLQDIDYGVVVSYGKILPERILKVAKKRFINLHPSSLPLFRGAAPIERTVEAGYTRADICVIEMVKALDAGNILAKQNYDISPHQDALDLHTDFAKIGASLIVDVIKNGSRINEKQNDALATYAHKIAKEELALPNMSKEITEVVINKVRAFASYGYCFVVYNGKRFKILKAHVSAKRLTPLDIECSDGFVSPVVIRPEGRGNINISEYQFSNT